MNRRVFLRNIFGTIAAATVDLPLPTSVPVAEATVATMAPAPVVSAGFIDIRQIIAENMLRDIQYEEDLAFITALKAATPDELDDLLEMVDTEEEPFPFERLHVSYNKITTPGPI